MPNEPDPFTFSIQEVADALNVSTDTILRQVHGGALQAIQVGRRVMVLSQSLADVVARHITDKRDERRQAVDRYDELVAADAAERRREAEAQQRDRERRLSPAGQRERAKREQKQREEREAAETGGIGQRIKTIALRGDRGFRANEEIGDAQVDASAVVKADPDYGKPIGAHGRKAYPLDGKVKETQGRVRQGLFGGERVG